VNPQPEAAWELHLFFTCLGIPYAIRDIESVIYRQRNDLDIKYVRRWLHDFAEVLANPEIEQRFERPWWGPRATG
jgi:hypothetical protein